MAEFAYNNRQYLDTGRLLFLVNLRRYPNIYEKDKELTWKVYKIDDFTQKIREARKEVEKALKKVNKIIRQWINKSREEAIKYKEEDLV